MIHLRHPYIPAAAAALCIILLAGWVHGDWTNRWGDGAELEFSRRYLPQLPKTIGDWVGEDIPETPDQLRQYKAAELRAAVSRQYVNPSGTRITIMAVSGTPGPIGTHTPEACFTGGGLIMHQPLSVVKFPATNPEKRPNMFWTTDFRPENSVVPVGQKVYWSFRPADPASPWTAATQPRADFASYRALYKLYVIHQIAMMSPSPVDDPVTPDFIRLLLPALESTVFDPMRNPAVGKR